MTTIPVVDLADFTQGDARQKQRFVSQLGNAYEDVGFVAVKNHGISDELIANLYKEVEQFSHCLLQPKKNIKSLSSPGSAAILLSAQSMQRAMMPLT